MKRNGTNVREGILQAALKQFAERGYAGASVQAIIAETQVTKPVLYYYFESKAGLYRALLDFARDQFHRLMQEAAGRSAVLEEQLAEILAAVFQFTQEHRDLSRLAFAAAFASPGELPDKCNNPEKGRRSFEFIHGLIKSGQVAGTLDKKFDSLELATGIYGALCFHAMVATLERKTQFNRKTAEGIVRLFLDGAKSKGKTVSRTNRRSSL
jgi:TetR/AcrR family transcriptional regulator